MVKLGKAAEQGLQQLFKSGQFATCWGFLCLSWFTQDLRGVQMLGMAEPTYFEFTLGINDYLVIWICKQSMDRNNMEGVRSGWDELEQCSPTNGTWLLLHRCISTDLFMIDCIKINILNTVLKYKKETAKLYSRVAVLFNIPTKTYEKSNFSVSLSEFDIVTIILVVLIGVIILLWFNLCIPNG